MADIYAHNDNRSLVIDGVRYVLPANSAEWMDVIAVPGGYDVVPASEKNKPLYTVKVDLAGSPKWELRNFALNGEWFETRGEYVTGPKGAVKEPVLIDFAGLVPPKARGVRVTYDATISTKSTGIVFVKFGSDMNKHQTSDICANKPTAVPCQIHDTFTIRFRPQYGQKISYVTESQQGIDKALTPPTLLVRGWWM